MGANHLLLGRIIPEFAGLVELREAEDNSDGNGDGDGDGWWTRSLFQNYKCFYLHCDTFIFFGLGVRSR